MKYTWLVWLMTEGSAPRIINALVSNGFTVAPGFKSNKSVSVGSGGCSATLGLILSHDNYQTDHPREIGKELSTILEGLDVPYYGSLTQNSSGSWSSTNGRLPKTDQPVPEGPYRTPGNV